MKSRVHLGSAHRLKLPPVKSIEQGQTVLGQHGEDRREVAGPVHGARRDAARDEPPIQTVSIGMAGWSRTVAALSPDPTVTGPPGSRSGTAWNN